MQAKDVMTSPVVTVGPDASVEQMAEIMLAHRISGVPVVDDEGRLQGIVSEGDLIRRLGAGAESRRSWWLALLTDREDAVVQYVKSHGRTAREVMTRDVVTAGERTPITKIASLLERHHIKRVPIVRGGKIVGIVSRANVLHGLAALQAAGSAAAATDHRVRSALLKELDRATVDRSHLNVVVTRGTVEFWGFVESEAQKRALAVAARKVKGVKNVADYVTIPPPMIQASMGAQ